MKPVPPRISRRIGSGGLVSAMVGRVRAEAAGRRAGRGHGDWQRLCASDTREHKAKIKQWADKRTRTAALLLIDLSRWIVDPKWLLSAHPRHCRTLRRTS